MAYSPSPSYHIIHLSLYMWVCIKGDVFKESIYGCVAMSMNMNEIDASG